MEESKVFVCDEMRKLRRILDKKGIEWKDTSTTGEMWVCQTRVDVGKKHYSIINGVGSYGGYSTVTKKNYGLLEAWDFRRGRDPLGSLTAEQAIDYMGLTYL